MNLLAIEIFFLTLLGLSFLTIGGCALIVLKNLFKGQK